MRSSRLVVFCKQDVLTKFAKTTRKILGLVFKAVADLQFNFIKKGDSGKCFLVSSTKFLVIPFLKNPLDGCLCVNTFRVIRSSHQRCSIEKVFLGISQNSQENAYASTLRQLLSQNKRLWHRRFPVNFAKFLRASSLQNTSERRLLCFQK